MNSPLNFKPSISILGCGWYGFPLAKKLIAEGYRVKGSTTREEKLAVLAAEGIESYLVDFELEQLKFDPSFFKSDILLISVPPKKSSPNLFDYPAKMKAMLEAAKKGTVKQLIFISSTGVYADENVVVTENTIPNPTTDSGKMMLAAEQLLTTETAFTTTIIRFAGLIGPERNLAKHFAGKTGITNGLAPINLIHLNDCIGLTETIIAQKGFGTIYNGVSPDHPTREAFYTKNCSVHGFEKPEFNAELLTWKQIESLHVPLLNYRYLVNNWEVWLSQISKSAK